MIRRKGIETRVKKNAPSANSKRNRPVSSWKISEDIVDQKNALRPNAANGKAVAVPRWSGKLDAATRPAFSTISTSWGDSGSPDLS